MTIHDKRSKTCYFCYCRPPKHTIPYGDYEVYYVDVCYFCYLERYYIPMKKMIEDRNKDRELRDFSYKK